MIPPRALFPHDANSIVIAKYASVATVGEEAVHPPHPIQCKADKQAKTQTAPGPAKVVFVGNKNQQHGQTSSATTLPATRMS